MSATPLRQRLLISLSLAAPLVLSASLFAQTTETRDAATETRDAANEQTEAAESPYAPPLSPDESLARLQIAQPLRVRLAAREPLVRDPISIAFDATGGMWVVEMGGYPLGVKQGRIKRLTDRDGDGEYDHSVVFLDGLAAPTSVLPWRDGLLIAAAPEILFARDTDGDGKADERKVVLTGFGLSNAQHQVNGLQWGLDNYVHAANGDSGGVVHRPSEAPDDLFAVDIHGHDFRFHPEAGPVQLESGMSQHTRFRDDWGNWFGGNSAWPLWHAQLPNRYLQRNPRADVNACPYVCDPAANPPVFPISREQPRLNEFNHQRRITSGCGGGCYRDDRLDESLTASVLVCDPANNLIHRMRLAPHGSTFRGRRVESEQQREFLASADPWFRPVQVVTGPDGALYVVDMYRLIIEHPDFFEREPGTLRPLGRSPQLSPKLTNLVRRGVDRGRIYRISNAKTSLRAWPLQRQGGDHRVEGDREKTNGEPDWMTMLASRNGVQRDLAHQAIVTSRRTDLTAAIHQLATRAPSPRVRVQAWATLAGLGALEETTLEAALRDRHPAVRRWATRLAELWIDRPAVLERVIDLTRDPDPQVRLQATLSLGQSNRKTAGRALGAVLRQANLDETRVNPTADPALRDAALSAPPRHSGAILQALIAAPLTESNRKLIAELLQAAFRNDDTELLAAGLSELARQQVEHPLRVRWLLGDLLETLQFAGAGWDTLRASDDQVAAAVDSLSPVFVAARSEAGDQKQNEDARLASIRLMGRDEDHQRDDIERLSRLLEPQESLPIQRAALRMLAGIDQPSVAKHLLAAWPRCGPTLQTEIARVLLDRRDWTLQLLRTLERSGEAEPPTFGVYLSEAQQQRLRNHSYRDVRELARRVLGRSDAVDDQQLAAFQAAIQPAEGDADRGAELYRKHCLTCHAARSGKGAGPPLTALTQLRPHAMIDAILHPNRAIEPAYAAYQVQTRDGRVLTGVIRREQAAALQLVDAEGRTTSLLRADVERLRRLETSLMPSQWTRVLKPKDVADLTRLLRSKDAPAKLEQSSKSP